MKKYSLFSVHFVSFLLIVHSGISQMQVKGRFLYSEANEKVILRGVNEMVIWAKKPMSNYFPEIAKSGANILRIVWAANGKPNKLDSAITLCLQNKMIPMIECHSATGKFENLQICVDYWKRSDIRAIIQKHKKWTLLNIANEAGNNSVSDSLYKAKYMDAINQIRSVGITVPLVIDAAGWGQNEQQIINTWAPIFNSDPLRNTLFSVHTYWVSDQKTRIDKIINATLAQNIPFIFGEGPEPFGSNCTSVFPYQYLLQKCQESEIGWIAWSWGEVKNGDCNGGKAGESGFDITKDGLFGNWKNTWASDIMVNDPNSIKNTSIRPTSLSTN